MAKNTTVQGINFGYSSATEFWTEVALPAHKRFQQDGSRGSAIMAALPAWHIHEWLWYENHPGVNTQRNPDYTAYRDRLIDECPELGWMRDVADAGKHRCLGRPPEVARMEPMDLPISTPTQGVILFGAQGAILFKTFDIELTDGTRHPVASALETVFAFWQRRFFPTDKSASA